MDECCMDFEMHLTFQNNSIARMIVGASYVFVGFEFVKAASIGMPLEGELTHVMLLLVLQGKVVTCQTEETLKTFIGGLVASLG
jgi:hypothetical protein